MHEEGFHHPVLKSLLLSLPQHPMLPNDVGVQISVCHYDPVSDSDDPLCWDSDVDSDADSSRTRTQMRQVHGPHGYDGLSWKCTPAHADAVPPSTSQQSKLGRRLRKKTKWVNLVDIKVLTSTIQPVDRNYHYHMRIQLPSSSTSTIQPVDMPHHPLRSHQGKDRKLRIKPLHFLLKAWLQCEKRTPIKQEKRIFHCHKKKRQEDVSVDYIDICASKASK